ncbi:MAG: retron system putative HNH endonuclease [Roseiarcus sp.]
MRFIRKGGEPKALSDWKSANRGLPDGSAFAAIPGDVKAVLREAMRREQGFLCADTMAQVDGPQGSHIEHIQPQWTCLDKATDYQNMVLCIPEKGPCAFGAFAKAGVRVDETNFVSPLNESCQRRLRYRFSGTVAPAEEDDKAAARTIALLALNHPILISARRDAIRVQGIVATHGRQARPLRGGISAAKARRLCEEVLAPDASGRLPPYCVAVSQAAATYARERELRARRLVAKPPQ